MVVLDTPQMTGRPAQMMSFMDAVKNVLLNNYVNFDGRASRSEYWWWLLATIPMSFPFFILDVIVFGWGIEDPTWFQNIFTVAILLPGLGVAIRRLHDSGRSGWWLLITIIPCVGLIVLIGFMAQDGEPYPNADGEVPTNILPTD